MLRPNQTLSCLILFISPLILVYVQTGTMSHRVGVQHGRSWVIITELGGALAGVGIGGEFGPALVASTGGGLIFGAISGIALRSLIAPSSSAREFSDPSSGKV